MAQDFEVSSSNFKNNDTMPMAQVYTMAQGKNLSPCLTWQGAPEGTKSFAIVCHDPDAPKDHGWYHWFLINIPSNVTEIAEGGKIEGTKELKTDFGKTGYDGPCPPVGHGVHHYNFIVYAIKSETLDINENLTPFELHNKIAENAIAKTTITATFER